jgi:cobalt-zinc-cadmium efflux system outer membrane protein
MIVRYSRTPPMLLAAIAALSSGCVSAHAGYREARAIVAARVHASTPAVEDGPDDSGATVDALLAKPLTADAAVRIALVRNADVRAAFDRIGMARGQLVSALRLPNPTLDGDVRFRSGRDTPDVDLGATIDLRELVLLPLRQRTASDELDAASIQAAALTMDIALHAREAYVDYVAAAATAELEREIVRTEEASATLASKIAEAGNAEELLALGGRADFEEATTALGQAEADAIGAREHLNGAMGLSGEDGARWKAAPNLADPPEAEMDTQGLEARALDASIDLGMVRARKGAAEGRVNLASVEGALPRIDVGPLAERDPDGWSVGPQIGIGVPIFYRGGGEIASARAAVDTEDATGDSIRVAIRARARSLAAALSSTRERAVHYRDVILPLRQRIVEETQRLYDAMGTSAFQLFAAKRSALVAGERYVDALRSYWMTRAELEMLLAGRLRVDPDLDLLLSGRLRIPAD